MYIAWLYGRKRDQNGHLKVSLQLASSPGPLRWGKKAWYTVCTHAKVYGKFSSIIHQLPVVRRVQTMKAPEVCILLQLLCMLDVLQTVRSLKPRRFVWSDLRANKVCHTIKSLHCCWATAYVDFIKHKTPSYRYFISFCHRHSSLIVTISVLGQELR